MEWLWKSFTMFPRYSPWYTIFFYMYDPILLNGNRNKIYTGTISANSSDLDPWYSRKIPAAKEKYTFSSTFQTLSNQESSASIVS